MSEMKERLEKLALEVANQRRKEFIQVWSDEIRNEAILLAEVFGIVEVSAKTLLLKESIKAWIKIKEKNNLIKEDKISVTRIMPNKLDQILDNNTVIASIIKNKIELKIYSKEMVENLVERFFT